MLRKYPQKAVVVFAVWEPMLPTDWSEPRTSVLQRLDDRRVRQFWDHDHMVATALKKAETVGKLHPDCCERKDVLWDLIAAYSPDVTWHGVLPQPALFNGTVVRAVGELDALIAKAP